MEAVTSISGPLLILAGPGSGKTRVVSNRVAYLMRTCGVSPHAIITVTFTNKAARELKSRIEEMSGARADQLTTGTFHSICARILRIDGARINIDPKFVIYDDDDQIKIMKQVLAELHLDERQTTPRAVLSGISKLKAEFVDPDEVSYRTKTQYDEIVRRVYGPYQEKLREFHALDFDDLLFETVRLLQLSPETAQKYQNRYLHIMVDEFQDTNIVQYELVKLLSAKHRNLVVVGDPDQSIYKFRSADIRNILNFERDFPDAKVVYLEQNYRSTQFILDAAQGVISANRRRKPKELWTDNGSGEKIFIRELVNELDEARHVVSEIDKLVDKGQFEHRDFAVMYRTNGQSRAIEQSFILHGIPYRLVGGTRFYERKEVKDILAYLRVLNNPDDALSVERILNVPARNIGQKTVDDLKRFARASHQSLISAIADAARGVDVGITGRALTAITNFAKLLVQLNEDADTHDVSELIQQIIERTGYRDYLKPDTDEGEERLENLQQLVGAAAEYSDVTPRVGLTRFIEEVALFTDLDAYDEGATAVTLITLHAAKGLEYPVVFIVGMEEGILPHSRSIGGMEEDEDNEELEEERRLLYVGITRAKKRLYLLRAFRRSMWGRSDMLPASRFLKDIPKEARHKEEIVMGTRPQMNFTEMLGRPRPQAPVTSASPPRPTSGMFSAGDKVTHSVFGDGIVVSAVTARDDLEVTVAFRDSRVGIKKLLQSFARLEKIPAR